MQAVVIRDGTEAAATSAEVAELVHGGEFFWLDLAGVDEEAATLLSDTFGFHRLAVTDAQHFGQRPKMNEFDDFTYFVVHGALPDGAGTSELHIFVTAHAVVTVHEQDCPALEDVKARIERRHASDVASPQVALLYVIVDSLVDTFFPELGRFDDQIDAASMALAQMVWVPTTTSEGPCVLVWGKTDVCGELGWPPRVAGGYGFPEPPWGGRAQEW